jgi:hypothetical protein
MNTVINHTLTHMREENASKRLLERTMNNQLHHNEREFQQLKLAAEDTWKTIGALVTTVDDLRAHQSAQASDSVLE